MEPIDHDTVVFVFGDGRELTVPDSALESGAHVVLVTAAPESAILAAGHPWLTIVPLTPGLGAFVRPIVEIVVVQLIMAYASESRSVTPEEFLSTQSDTKLGEEPQ